MRSPRVLRWVRLLVAALAGSLAAGCDQAVGAAVADHAPVQVIGGSGNRDGRFVKCRAVTVDASGTSYIIDRTGRIQVFDADGNYLRGWAIPDISKGTPEDVEIDRKGNLLVTDTHFARILVYSPDGVLLRQWGGWGKEPGQFIYPVGLATDADNHVYVAEYGGNDRIQKFDEQGNLITVWGAFGEAEGQFQRPEDLCVDAQGRVFVADSCNHRIQVFTGEGKFLAAWGTVGDGAGAMRYPYDVECDGSGGLVVCEYGNHRVQQFSVEGRPGRTWGAVGFGVRQLNFPWDLAVGSDGSVYVADTQNHRVQHFRFE